MVSSWHVGSCQMRTCSAHFRPLRGLGSSEHVSRVFARIFVIKSILAFSVDFQDFWFDFRKQTGNKLATPSLGESGERANPCAQPHTHARIWPAYGRRDGERHESERAARARETRERRERYHGAHGAEQWTPEPAEGLHPPPTTRDATPGPHHTHTC